MYSIIRLGELGFANSTVAINIDNLWDIHIWDLLKQEPVYF